jgi:hypothetical protein
VRLLELAMSLLNSMDDIRSISGFELFDFSLLVGYSSAAPAVCISSALFLLLRKRCKMIS